MTHWLLKSEPDVFSFDDLTKAPGRTTAWDGVRNYQARNFMRDDMKPGDPVLFYHSSTQPPGVVGVAEVASAPYPDPAQFDPASNYYDAKATDNAPRWFVVDVKAVEKLPRPVTLSELKKDPRLTDMRLVQRGNRLSVMPVTAAEFGVVLELAET